MKWIARKLEQYRRARKVARSARFVVALELELRSRERAARALVNRQARHFERTGRRPSYTFDLAVARHAEAAAAVAAFERLLARHVPAQEVPPT